MDKVKSITISKEMQDRMDKYSEALVIFDDFHDYLEGLSSIEIKARMEMKKGYRNDSLNITYDEYFEKFEESQEIHSFLVGNMMDIFGAINKIKDVISSTIVFEENYKGEIGYQKRKYITNKT